MNALDTIRAEVRKVIAETGMGGNYYMHGNTSGRFPYDDRSDTISPAALARKSMAYGIDNGSGGNVANVNSKSWMAYENFDDFSDNDEMYDFPIEEFKKGIKQEMETYKEDMGVMNPLEVGHIVIDNLISDHKYYSSGKNADDEETGDEKETDDEKDPEEETK